MAIPATSLALSTVTINSLNLLELTQDLDIMAQNTLVNAKGAADRYVQNQITKQKQSITFTGHWNNVNLTPNIKATNLSIGIFTLGGTAYVGYLKSGSIEVTTSGPEVSGIAQLEEYPLPTSTDFSITGDIQIVSADALNYLNLTAVEGGFGVTVAISWAVGGTGAGEAITFDGILSSTSHKVSRDQAQIENVTIKLQDVNTAPTVKYNGTNETTSILYAAMLGTAVTTFDIDTGVNIYQNQASGSGSTALISRYSVRFADKQVIMQSFTLEMQGGMAATSGG
jgi:hypothetical protein